MHSRWHRRRTAQSINRKTVKWIDRSLSWPMSYAPQLRDSSTGIPPGSPGCTSKCSGPSFAAARPHWEAMSMSVCAAAIRPSLSIRAGTGIALTTGAEKR
jgi:hypothetical protein